MSEIISIMQVCTITQAVHLRKIHGRAAKRAPWIKIAAVHGGGIRRIRGAGDQEVVERLLRDPDPSSRIFEDWAARTASTALKTWSTLIALMQTLLSHALLR